MEKVYKKINREKKFWGYVEGIISLIGIILLIAIPYVGILFLPFMILSYVFVWIFKMK